MSEKGSGGIPMPIFDPNEKPLDREGFLAKSRDQLIPPGTVYQVSEPEFCGAFPIRT